MLSLLKRKCGPIVLLMALSAGSQAQALRKLPLQEAIRMAKEHSYQLRSDSLQYSIAQSKSEQSRNGRIPQLDLNASYRRLSNNITPTSIPVGGTSFEINPQLLNQYNNSLQLTQVVFAGGKINNNIRASAKEADATRADYEKGKLDIETATTELWFALYNARAAEKAILTNIGSLQQRRKDLEGFMQQGLVLANDVLKIDLSITNLRSNLADVTSQVGQLNYNLCIATGIDPVVGIEITEEYLQPLNPIDSLNTYVNAAIAQRPDLSGLKLRMEAADYRVKAAKADYYPSLNIMGNYSYDNPNQRIIPNVDKFNYTAFAGIGLAWNISSLYSNRAKVSESKLSRMQVEYGFQQGLENVRKDINANYLDYKRTLDKVTLVETELDQAKENYRVEENRLNAQTSTLTDFLIANSNLLQAQIDMATAKANAELSYRRLIRSTGVSNN